MGYGSNTVSFSRPKTILFFHGFLSLLLTHHDAVVSRMVPDDVDGLAAVQEVGDRVQLPAAQAPVEVSA